MEWGEISYQDGWIEIDNEDASLESAITFAGGINFESSTEYKCYLGEKY